MIVFISVFSVYYLLVDELKDELIEIPFKYK